MKLPAGQVGVAYSQTLAISGGMFPYTWSIFAGSLPDGLSLSSDGLISGAPTSTGTSSFTVQVTDSLGATATKSLSITINEAPINNKPPVIDTVTLSPDNDPGLPGVQINPTAGGTTTVSVSIQARDDNGYNDISMVSVVVYKPDGTTVHVPSGDATLSSGNGTHSNWTYNFNMNFYDAPATGAATYTVVATATDSQGATGDNSASPALFNYDELIGLSLNTNTIFHTRCSWVASEIRDSPENRCFSPLAPILGGELGSWGIPPDPLQRGFAPCGIPIFILHGAGDKPAWRIPSKIAFSTPCPPFFFGGGGNW